MPIGRLAYQITNAFAELERVLIAERTKADMAAAKCRGVCIGRLPKLSSKQIAQAAAELATGAATPAALDSRFRVSQRTLARALKTKGRSS